MTTVADLLVALQTAYPLTRAESWDKVGLQIGSAAAPLERVLVAHEVTSDVLDEAEDCQALLVYHPPIFGPLPNLDFAQHPAGLVARCIRENLNVVAAHTALDNAPQPQALGDKLASQLGLHHVEVLAPSGREPLCKLVVFVPECARERVTAALWQAGAGTVGCYDHASFRSRGHGTFRPMPGAHPVVGTIGSDEEVREWRLEVTLPVSLQAPVLAAMKRTHPYEVVAHDLYPLFNSVAPYGPARVGLVEPLPLQQFAAQVQATLKVPAARVVAGVGSADRLVTKVACVPGSGASFIDEAVAAGCHCLVSGDFKHHDALKAAAAGLSLVDATHVATESHAVDMLFNVASSAGVPIRRGAASTNPFAAV